MIMPLLGSLQPRNLFANGGSCNGIDGTRASLEGLVNRWVIPR